MNWRKNMLLVVGGSISLVLVLLAGFLLFRYQASFQKVNSELKDATDKLDRLNHSDPYPSAENTAMAQKNRETLAQYLANVQETLQRDQIEPEQIEPAEFAALLERSVREIRASAGATKLPERTSLAFDRYAQGELPAVDAIPRLVIQAKSIKALLGILMAAKVDEVIDIQRTIFESTVVPAEGEAAQAPAADEGGLPPPETNDLYTAERIKLSFIAREHAAWEVLNALGRSKLFAVVNHVEITNPSPVPTGAAASEEGKEGSAPAGTATAAPVTIYKSHDERIVAGREPIRVDLAVDVYRFAGQTKPGATP